MPSPAAPTRTFRTFQQRTTLAFRNDFTLHRIEKRKRTNEHTSRDVKDRDGCPRYREMRKSSLLCQPPARRISTEGILRNATNDFRQTTIDVESTPRDREIAKRRVNYSDMSTNTPLVPPSVIRGSFHIRDSSREGTGVANLNSISMRPTKS